MNIKNTILIICSITANILHASEPEQKTIGEKMIRVKVQEWKPHAKVTTKTIEVLESATIKTIKDKWAEAHKLANDARQNLQIVGHNDDVSVSGIENSDKKPLIIFSARAEASGHREPYYD
jgi:hypothetical protein